MSTEGKDTNTIQQRLLRSNSPQYIWANRVLLNSSILFIQCTTNRPKRTLSSLFPENLFFYDVADCLHNWPPTIPPILLDTGHSFHQETEVIFPPFDSGLVICFDGSNPVAGTCVSLGPGHCDDW